MRRKEKQERDNITYARTKWSRLLVVFRSYIEKEKRLLSTKNRTIVGFLAPVYDRGSTHTAHLAKVRVHRAAAG